MLNKIINYNYNSKNSCTATLSIPHFKSITAQTYTNNGKGGGVEGGNDGTAKY